MIDWQAVAAVAEALGALVVVLSVIYLARQVRQNTVATQAATFHSHMAKETDLLTTWGSDPDLARIFYTMAEAPEKLDELTPDERHQAEYLFLAIMRVWEDLYLQRGAGTLSQTGWEAREDIVRWFLASPALDRERIMMNFSGPFRDYIEAVRSETRPASHQSE